MKLVAPALSLSAPRWDGSRVLFEIAAAGRVVPCAISRSALQDVTGRRQFAATELLKNFVAARPRIEAIAARMFGERPESVSGIVSIWADDIDDPPAAPAVASAVPRQMGA